MTFGCLPPKNNWLGCFFCHFKAHVVTDGFSSGSLAQQDTGRPRIILKLRRYLNLISISISPKYLFWRDVISWEFHQPFPSLSKCDIPSMINGWWVFMAGYWWLICSPHNLDQIGWVTFGLGWLNLPMNMSILAVCRWTCVFFNQKTHNYWNRCAGYWAYSYIFFFFYWAKVGKRTNNTGQWFNQVNPFIFNLIWDDSRSWSAKERLYSKMIESDGKW